MHSQQKPIIFLSAINESVLRQHVSPPHTHTHTEREAFIHIHTFIHLFMHILALESVINLPQAI